MAGGSRSQNRSTPRRGRRTLTITRKPSESGFHYFHRGRRMSDPAQIERIDKLAIPPAWTDVRISRSASTKVLATGVDAAGRTQTIYHPRFRRQQDQAKFDRILEFAENLPRLRRQVDRDLRRRRLSEDKVVALVIKLMDEQFFRVGNKRYAEQNGSYGITTLRRKHIEVNSASVSFDFIGKSGKRHQKKIRDPRIARLIAQLNELPGYEVFRFFDDEGELHDVQSSHVNAYVKEHMGEDFSAKDFRTWGGTLMTVSLVLAEDPPEDDIPASAQKRMRTVVEQVAEKLGNTPAVTKDSYIDPRVLAAFEDKATIPRLRTSMSRMRPRTHMSVEEQAVLKLLRELDA